MLNMAQIGQATQQFYSTGQQTVWFDPAEPRQKWRLWLGQQLIFSLVHVRNPLKQLQ